MGLSEEVLKVQTEVSVKTIRRRQPASLLLATTVTIACTLPREQREMLAADAETFEAVVRSQMSDSVGTAFLRVDSRPAGDKEILSSTQSTAGGLDPDSATDSVPEPDVRSISDQRKQILRDLHIEEGGPFDYPQCGGFRVNRFRDTAPVHPNRDCPKTFHRYVTVGLPTRGATPAVTKARPADAPLPDTTGEQWTVLVTETAVGPGGQQFRQYAWLFRRDAQTGGLGVVEKYLLSWAE